ncbi:hypothetical protein A3A69_01095 [candidate division WWE3 bacterium RIFCSPLOWO2_01_FULL_37_15]|uniref:Uncharacterized protein n=1 Tax=candidate division WWE3 bacterium RIFCSPLOWO2_01_FULL_37_15 TaxID=1802622 RepID=A0A1F4V1B7_UNCKA|nr:MAG: hypothetical protein A3A69_01095 [candidate division WWE3 bacterium RIFCSPLOWO2_01_FULL_37_15]
MAHRQGGKITRSHTTAIELSAKIVDFLQKQELVTKISLGPIEVHGAGRGASWTVKIVDESRCILVASSQSGTVQQIRFYTGKPQEVKLALARFIRDSGWGLRFGKLV